MYTEEEERKGFPIRDFLIKLVLIIIFVLLLMWLLPIPDMDGVNNKVFNANIQEMKDAAISYYTTDRLPQKIGDKSILTLKQMLELKLLLPFTDKNGDTCDVNKSYVQLEKLEDEYLMKVYLKCNEEEDYILVHLGCYSYCTGDICEKEEEEVTKGPSCELEVKEGTLGSKNWYKSDVTVAFKSKKTTTDNAKITGYGLSTSNNATYNNNDKLVVSKDGSTKVYGYVKDSSGKVAVCNITIKKDTAKPSCKLSVLSGTKDASGTYVSDVVVGFASKTDATSGVRYYDITNSSNATYTNKNKYTVRSNGTHKIYGYVKDEAGNTNSCSISVKRKADETQKVSVPNCSLEVTSGTIGQNSWYIDNVGIGFASKTSTNGAKIVDYGIGTSEKYGKIDSYSVTKDGNHTIYGYVKDSNGNTATCSIKVKRDVTRPSCSLTVTSGTYNSNGYYTSNVVVGFASNTDKTSGISAYGIGTSENYLNQKTYSITAVGTHKIYGYVKDEAGNTNSCSISVTRKNLTYEYQYKKDFAAVYSAWSEWTTKEYLLNNPPAFGTTATQVIEDLGSSEVPDGYTYKYTNAIKQTKTRQAASYTAQVCKNYDYYKLSSTESATYAIKAGTEWKYVETVTLTGVPSDTLDTKWEYVGLDWESCGDSCSTTPYTIWKKYTREVYTVTVDNTITNTNGIVIKCSDYETKTVYVNVEYESIVGYNQERTPKTKTIYQYKIKTRNLITSAYTDYRWSTYNDSILLAQDYKMTGVSRIVE